MPIALDSNGGVKIGGSSFIRGMPCISICDRDFPPEQHADDDDDDDDCRSSSSSIGRNRGSSEDCSDQEDSGENEVQSSLKGPLDTINALEEVLPVEKGISKFYSGKSKSFTNLADASSATSLQDIVKPEDPYAKKRKNLLAHNLFFCRSRDCSDNGGEISKRPANVGGRGTSLSSLSSNGNSEEGNSESTSPRCFLPPLHPHATRSPANASPPFPPPRNLPWRSYSWSDLQSVAAESHDISGLAICSGNKVH